MAGSDPRSAFLRVLESQQPEPLDTNALLDIGVLQRSAQSWTDRRCRANNALSLAEAALVGPAAESVTRSEHRDGESTDFSAIQDRNRESSDIAWSLEEDGKLAQLISESALTVAQAQYVDQSALSWRTGFPDPSMGEQPLAWQRRKRKIEDVDILTSDGDGPLPSAPLDHVDPDAPVQKLPRVSVRPARWFYPLDAPDASKLIYSAVSHQYAPFEARQGFDAEPVHAEVSLQPFYRRYVPPSRRPKQELPRPGDDGTLQEGASALHGVRAATVAQWVAASTAGFDATPAERTKALQNELRSERQRNSESMLASAGLLAPEIASAIDEPLPLLVDPAFLEKLPPATRILARNLGTDETGKTPLINKRQFQQHWSQIAKRDIVKASRSMSAARANRVLNAKKVSLIVLKELRRRAQSSVKVSRASVQLQKKATREVMAFWRKNAKTEKDLAKLRAKELEEQRRAAEEAREAERQKRKLNFLLTQTELFTHFLGGKADSADTIAAADMSADQAAIAIAEGDDESLRAAAAHAAQAAARRQRESTQTLDSELAELRQTESAAPSTAAELQELREPKMMTATLKGYQRKGLGWLANLYEQGINGILADEMGLGKTIQSIAFISWLAETKGIWGPFLIISPVSTLHNWKHEISRFSPNLKLVPYWGSVEDRKVLRRNFNPKKLYRKDSAFHVCITSYNLVVKDEAYFRRVKWQYMILDEAQAMKSSASQRWKVLLGFNCRNRLLLTGTPIQNSMAELWSLLHFIMPTLFDSHAEFSEWFSKGVENQATGGSTLDAHELRRLHTILKPFMLRRVKTEVEQEIGEKTEVEIPCEMSPRQAAVYRSLRNRVSLKELLGSSLSSQSQTHRTKLTGLLHNLVMQFRKVCNHPDLFERRCDVKSPFFMCQLNHIPPPVPHAPVFPPGRALAVDLIPVVVPNQHWSLFDSTAPRLLFDLVAELSLSRFGFSALWDLAHIVKSSNTQGVSAFGFSRLSRLSPADLVAPYSHETLDRLEQILESRASIDYIDVRSMLQIVPIRTTLTFGAPGSPIASDDGTVASVRVLVSEAVAPTLLRHVTFFNAFTPRAVSNGPGFMRSSSIPGGPFLRSRGFVQQHTREHLALRACAAAGQWTAVPPSVGMSALADLLSGSGKLATLDKLLTRLKRQGHRVLIYSQMTRMLDILGQLLTHRRYHHLRLDGSTSLEDRRDMVHHWQTRDEVFVFLLSTRAGGLGINLTAADTVIFYDSDWNPTQDQQAMDRAHRLGQLKPVTVYRLVTRGTVEEKILKRAQQKHAIQKIVIAGSVSDISAEDVDAIQAVDKMTTSDMVNLLQDDDETEDAASASAPDDASKKRRRAGW